MSFRIELTPAAKRDLLKIDRTTLRRIGDAIDGLAEQPRPAGCVKLSGEDNLWRVRVGNYRIVYAIEDRKLLVLVVRVADRKDVYR